MPPEPALYLSASDVQRCLSESEIIDLVTQTLSQLNTGNVVKGPKAGFGVQIDDDHLHMGSVSGCLLAENAAGIKWFITSDKNSSRNLPRVPATLVLCNARTGILEGVVDGTQLTCERTAAMAVAAAAASARRPIRTAAVIGAGPVGRAVMKYLAATQPLDRLAVAALSRASADEACHATGKFCSPNMALCATSDVSQAVADADVVITATGAPADTDIVRAEWLKADAIVCALGSCREVDHELISHAHIVVDDRDGVQMRGNLASEFRTGRMTADRIDADIASLMSGQGSPPLHGRVLLALVGLGVLDVALGARALRAARSKGLGVRLTSGVQPA